MLDVAMIDEAAELLDGRIRRTPLEPSPPLTERLGVPVSLKLEALQVTGSFKIRGAFFRLARLTEEERGRGVATCSAGNHGVAMAFAARALGVPVRIHVPASVDEVKYRRIGEMGAEVVRAECPGYDETELLARREAEADGLPFVSAYEDEAVMAGNGGTLAREIVEDAPETRWIAVPVSGGGLAGGLAVYLEQRAPRARFVACQHRDSASLARSLELGRAAIAMPPIETLAGGIEGGIGRANFDILRDRVARVALASEGEIRGATAWMLDTHQYLVEPSAAVTVATCLSGAIGAVDGPLVVVLSGRNVSPASVREILVG